MITFLLYDNTIRIVEVLNMAFLPIDKKIARFFSLFYYPLSVMNLFSLL